MMRRLAAILLVSFVLYGPTRASAAVFYVDNSTTARCANTTSNGSAATPWCTIDYALTRIRGGDTLYVKSGVYPGAFTISGSLSGTSDAPTTISAYPGASVTIQGAGVHSGRLRIQGAAHITVNGFTVTAMNQGIFVEASHHIVLANLAVTNIGQEGIHIFANSAHVTVRDSVISNTGQWAYNGEGIYIGSGSTAARDNTNNIIVRDSTIHDTADEGIELKPGTHDCLIEGNILYSIRTPFGPEVGAIEIGEHATGNQFWGGNPNHTVRGNVVRDSVTGIRAGTGSSLYNNIVYRPQSGHYGIYVNNLAKDNYQRLIYHNTISTASSHAIVVASGAVDIRNNIGPSLANNVAFSPNYFVSSSTGDYHLVQGTAPIDAGSTLSGVVSTDADGNQRPIGSRPDLGAYEFGSNPPAPPTNVKIVR